MFGLFFLLFTLVPALELYLLFAIGGQIGGLNTILIIIMTGIAGAALAKSQGLQILYDIQTKANRGELPGDQIIHGLMVFAGGLLLLTPGFMTDIIGFSLVIPGSRHLLMAIVKKMLHNSIQNGNFNVYGFSSRAGATSQGGFYSYSEYQYNDKEDHRVTDDGNSNVIEAEFSRKE